MSVYCMCESHLGFRDRGVIKLVEKKYLSHLQRAEKSRNVRKVCPKKIDEVETDELFVALLITTSDN